MIYLQELKNFSIYFIKQVDSLLATEWRNIF